MWRYKRGIAVSYEEQGYIYFLSRRYQRLGAAEQAEVRRLCRKAGGPYWRALLAFVTTDVTATAVTMRHHMSKATLYRCVKRYYEDFPLERE